MTAPSIRGLPARLADARRTLVMGVLNVTPDSFSDGGAYLDPAAAVAHGLDLLAEGADILDVGGESTRPGAQRVSAEEECSRVLPVIRELSAAGAVVSIDTMRASTAEAALAAGAAIVNDVSGGLADLDMAKVVAHARVPYVAMHWRGHSVDMAERAVYDDVVAEVVGELRARLDSLVAAGLEFDQVVLDPGIGFAKQGEHNWQLLARVDALTKLGRPLLVGVSRKSFLGTLLADESGAPRPTDGREDATVALTALLAEAQVWGVRVHEVRPNVDAVRVVTALRSARAGSPECES